MTHAELSNVADGIWAAVAKPDRGAVGNAAIVQLGKEVLVVDTHVSPAAARELRENAEQLAGQPVAWVLNTHWHADHVLGNGEFPGETIVSTTRTRELIATVGAERLAGQKQSLEHRLPDETFDNERAFDGARALTLGGGHTESDAFLLVPDAGILVAGDLIVVGMQPWAGHGSPAGWADILARLLELEWETCVPGHGPVSGREVVEPLRDYLLVLDEAVRGGASKPQLPARFEAWGQPEMWARNVAALRERYPSRNSVRRSM